MTWRHSFSNWLDCEHLSILWGSIPMSLHVPKPLYHKENEFRSGARLSKNSCMMNNLSMLCIQKDRSHSIGGGARRWMIVFTIHAYNSRLHNLGKSTASKSWSGRWLDVTFTKSTSSFYTHDTSENRAVRLLKVLNVYLVTSKYVSQWSGMWSKLSDSRT